MLFGPEKFPGLSKNRPLIFGFSFQMLRVNLFYFSAYVLVQLSAYVLRAYKEN